MRISRLAVGFVAGPLAIAIALALAYLEVRFFGILHWKLIIVLALASGAGMFGLADRLGVLAAPQTPKPFLLSDDEGQETASPQDAGPIVPR